MRGEGERGEKGQGRERAGRRIAPPIGKEEKR
jgi:hypothetical protein